MAADHPEVQGDVYLAWRLMADLFERDGDTRVDLQYRRSEQGTLIAVTRKQGDLLVSVES